MQSHHTRVLFLRFGRFLFSGKFWVHRYEVMIRSIRNEKEMKEHEEEQRLEGDLIIFGGA